MSGKSELTFKGSADDWLHFSMLAAFGAAVSMGAEPTDEHRDVARIGARSDSVMSLFSHIAAESDRVASDNG